MSLEQITWNHLYAAHPDQREFAETRIRLHFKRRKLAKRGAVKASVRPTGWHGESGLATAGGHIVVDWYRLDGTHVTTHHVYPTDDAYPVLCIYPPQNSLVLHALPLPDPKSIRKTAFGLATPKPLLNSGGSGWNQLGKIDTEAVP
ncbi:hypothetical protein BYT27DRAFT_7219267 [Phlegmacium glaucopus]|nr:hypothetical protein BYT27DRAFT_7219267 [Phlegmacium glaucopus]